MTEFKIGDRMVGHDHPTYFIADISANHDGDIERAKLLIRLAASSGADAAKFQNFRANHIVSDRGFRSLGEQRSHQSGWKKSVFEVYQGASIPWEWTPILKQACEDAGICYFSSPYDLGAVDMLDPFVPVYKVGSGDITWPEIYLHIAAKGKPVLLATGASDIGEVQRAVNDISAINSNLGLMQCNTNYTPGPENFRHINLRVLDTYRIMFPNVVLGLSDHTLGHTTVLGAVALGARLIEKHFTDDQSREGPDHPFSMNPQMWRDMVDSTRELELALGVPNKVVAFNEKQTVVIQRRCLRAAMDLPGGALLEREMIDVLRPAIEGSIAPTDIDRVIGRKLRRALKAGEHFNWMMFGE